MIIKSILHEREQAQRKVCAPSKHHECLKKDAEVPGPPPALPLLPLLSRPRLRFPHPWEIAFLFFFLLCLYWIYCNIASVLCFEVFGHEACGILVPWLGTEPTPLALGGEVLTTGLSGKSSFFFLRPRNSGQGCKMVAKETCALGVPRVPFRSLTP